MPDGTEANLDSDKTPVVPATPAPEVDEFQFQDDNTAPPVVAKPAAPATVTPPAGDPDDVDENQKIHTAVQQAVAPVLESLSPLLNDREAQRVNNDWEQIVKDFPEAKGMETKVKRWASTEGSIYKGNVQGAFQAIAGSDFYIKIGAKRSKAASKEADETKSEGGTTTRPAENAGGVNTDATDLRGKSPAEINKVLQQLRRPQAQT